MSIVVTRTLGLATVQDLGRRGHMHEAVPPGGALVPELLVAANRAARNVDDAPAVEIFGELTVRATENTIVATDRTPVRLLREGESLTVASEPRRVAYLALRGGIAAPRVLDGYGTLLSAGLGAPLRIGDTLDAAELAETDAPPVVLPAADVVHVIPGPDRDAFEGRALEVLTEAPYRVLPNSDRVGTRLSGAMLPRISTYREVSRPMVAGAIEVPRDGQPIVLGPEHPTTGGYPIVAVIESAELGRFHAIRLGGSVQFALRSRRR